jgi:hypothetical protein
MTTGTKVDREVEMGAAATLRPPLRKITIAV